MLNPGPIVTEDDTAVSRTKNRIIFPAPVLVLADRVFKVKEYPCDLMIVGNKGLVGAWWASRQQLRRTRVVMI